MNPFVIKADGRVFTRACKVPLGRVVKRAVSWQAIRTCGSDRWFDTREHAANWLFLINLKETARTAEGKAK